MCDLFSLRPGEFTAMPARPAVDTAIVAREAVCRAEAAQVRAIAIAGMVGVHLLVNAGQWPQAVVLAVGCTVATVRCLIWQTAGIRKDIRTGRALAS